MRSSGVPAAVASTEIVTVCAHARLASPALKVVALTTATKQYATRMVAMILLLASHCSARIFGTSVTRLPGYDPVELSAHFGPAPAPSARLLIRRWTGRARCR